MEKAKRQADAIRDLEMVFVWHRNSLGKYVCNGCARVVAGQLAVKAS